MFISRFFHSLWDFCRDITDAIRQVSVRSCTVIWTLVGFPGSRFRKQQVFLLRGGGVVLILSNAHVLPQAHLFQGSEGDGKATTELFWTFNLLVKFDLIVLWICKLISASYLLKASVRVPQATFAASIPVRIRQNIATIESRGLYYLLFQYNHTYKKLLYFIKKTPLFYKKSPIFRPIL